MIKISKIFIFVLYSSIVSAQNISITASVDKNKLALNEQLTLRVTVIGDVSNLPAPTLPALPGFTAYSAGTSQSQNISFINGKVSSSISYTYNYVLVPKSIGKFTIEPITINYQNQVYKTEPISVEVVQAGTQQPPSQQLQPTPLPQTDARKKVFITTSVDKKTAYVGEQITLSFKFFRNVQLFSQPQYTPPQTIGFFTEDLPPQQECYADIGGRRYLVSEIKTALFPTAPGKYTIGPAQLQCNIRDFSADDFFSDDFFSSFFSGGKTQILKTNPIEITVLPLPSQGKPANFTGTVGDYKIDAKLDKEETKINQPLTLTITISGKGNIKTISQPYIPEIKGFKKYQTLSSLNLSKENYQVQGTKVFKTIFIPQVSGKQIIPEIYFNCFNPNTKTYQTLKTNPITINIQPAAKEEQKLTVITPEGVKVIATDIRYIKSGKISLNKNTKPLYKNTVFVLLQFLPILSLLFSYRYKIRTEKLTKDIKYARFTRGYKIANKQLQEIKKVIKTAQPNKEFYTKLADTFTGYIANKLNLSQAGLTLSILTEELYKKNINSELVKKIETLWQEYDFARFAPNNVTDNSYIENIFIQTQQIINELEKIFKNWDK